MIQLDSGGLCELRRYPVDSLRGEIRLTEQPESALPKSATVTMLQSNMYGRFQAVSAS